MEREKQTFKSLGVDPAFPHIEGKHSEPWHNILHALFDTIMTPPQYVELVILLEISLLLEMDMLVIVIILVCLSCLPEGKTGKSLSWVDPSLSLVPRRDECVRHGMRGMMSGDSVCWMKYTRYANLVGNT